MKQATINDIQFLPAHFNYEHQIQSFSKWSFADIYIIALIDPLSENQIFKNSVCDNYFKTKSMQNDLVLILLNLLVS